MTDKVASELLRSLHNASVVCHQRCTAGGSLWGQACTEMAQRVSQKLDRS